MSVARPEVVIIGAGPAGLTAAYELSKSGVSSVILEKESTAGGLARTAEYKQYLFDIGGHRFFTKVPMVEAMWREVLGSNLLTRPRLSRIYYNSKFFNYPLKPFNAFFGLGPIETLRCMSSYAKARMFPVKPARSFEDWVTNCFGRRLFEIFFRTYTEKVWGIPCSQIRAEWAAQRIRGLSMATLLRSFVRPLKITTLIDEFLYPRRGPGMMWSETQKLVEARGSQIVFEAPVEKIQWKSGNVTAVVAGGRAYRADHFISSMPIRELIERLDPAPPEDVIEAARGFHYRDFLTVALIVRGRNLFPDNCQQLS